MYCGGKKSSISHLSQSNMNTSSVIESNLQTMQREIDNYTRLLQQQKRKYFRVQETHQEVIKDYDQKVKEIENLKSRKYKTEMSRINSHVKILQSTLQQTISSFNDAVSKNNVMKNEIDQLRKEKKNQDKTVKILEEKNKLQHKQIQNKRANLEHKKDKIEHIKNQIISIRDCNIEETVKFRHHINQITQNYKKTQSSDLKKKNDPPVTNESIDSQPLTKIRLRNIILQNKQKLRIIEQYKKSMQLIHNNFEQIRNQSAINSLQEITTIFIKQQKQNMFICEYINKLHQQLEDIQQSNVAIQVKIQKQQQTNRQYQGLLVGTPQQEQNQKRLQKCKRDKNNIVQCLELFLQKIYSSVSEVGDILLQGTGQTKLILNHHKIEHYLSILETHLNQRLSSTDANISYKQTITSYSKLVPCINTEEIKDKTQDKLLQNDKLRQYAMDYWQRKKNRTNKDDII